MENFPTTSETARLTQVVNEIGSAELDRIAHKYGTAEGPGQAWLPYHNATHTMEVAIAAEQIGNQLVHGGKIGARDVQLLKLAAFFHDDEQDLGGGLNEAASAHAAIRAMKQEPDVFGPQDIDTVQRAIMATRVEFPEGHMIQLVDKQDTIGCALADADLASLGRDIELNRSLMLDLELQMKKGLWSPSTGLDPDREGTIKNLTVTVGLLQEHRYHLPESEARYGARQQENHRALVRALDAYSRGVVTHKDLLEASREGAGLEN